MLEDKNLQSLYPMFPYPNIAQVPVEPVSASVVFPVRSGYNSCNNRDPKIRFYKELHGAQSGSGGILMILIMKSFLPFLLLTAV